MRACGQCGKPGHNRRTCDSAEPSVVPAPEKVPAKVAAASQSSSVKDDKLDPDVQLAIDNYLETLYPGFRERRLAGRAGDDE
jgi:hypothetical protein